MDVQICGQCNWPMEDSHFNICWTCWRDTQGHKRIKSDLKYEALQKIIHKLLQEETPPDHQANILKVENHQLKIQMNQLKMQISCLIHARDNSPKHPLDQNLIKTLLMFCHPDKNQTREVEAGEITKTLLKMREKEK